MISRLINKISFFKKLPKVVVKPIFKILILFDEIFWNFRITMFLLFKGKVSKLGSVISQLKENGYAIFENYYSDDYISKIKNNCIKILDDLPVKELNTTKYIPNLVLPNGIRVEKLKGSIKIKGLNEKYSFFNEISNNLSLKTISAIYQLNWKPFLIYNLVHDGTFKHPVMGESAGEKMIAGQPHIDMPFHELRCALALDNIDEDNGPTIVFKKSMREKKMKKNHLNIFLERFGFDVRKESGHNLNKEDLDYLEENSEKVKITCKKGDLILLDLKSAHYQSILKKKERHILWHYF
ncbi:phytanoyl-CoA dioxygenase family protein [Pelagibacteraceae bacterium]|nr:phytanoyl-CoA dioxygenase family protein [Pelagibacteraceae bacterium]